LATGVSTATTTLTSSRLNFFISFTVIQSNFLRRGATASIGFCLCGRLICRSGIRSTTAATILGLGFREKSIICSSENQSTGEDEDNKDPKQNIRTAKKTFQHCDSTHYLKAGASAS
jgi:hypothetical protein